MRVVISGVALLELVERAGKHWTALIQERDVDASLSSQLEDARARIDREFDSGNEPARYRIQSEIDALVRRLGELVRNSWWTVEVADPVRRFESEAEAVADVKPAV